MIEGKTKQGHPIPAEEFGDTALVSEPKNVRQRLPIGADDFRKIREANLYYIDKTLMIKDFIESGGEVTLITRPRRFGKTLNMSMIRDFFDTTQDSRDIFKGLAIMYTEYGKEINSKPVIYLSFRDCDGINPQRMFDNFRRELYREFRRFEKILGNRIEYGYDKEDFYSMLKLLQNNGTAYYHYTGALSRLTEIVYGCFKIKPLLLIDEYDQPMMSSYEYGYKEEVSSFFSSFYGSAMKSNESLDRALLTGVQKIAQESIFSKFNNVDVYTVLDNQYSAYFGLGADETKALLSDYGIEFTDRIQKKYDGYVFSNHHMYNPWSLLNYVNRGTLNNYWNKTGSNSLIKKLLGEASTDFWSDFNKLIISDGVLVDITLEMAYADLNNSVNLWGLLLNAGYITATDKISDNMAIVKIPNDEVMDEFKTVISGISGMRGTDLYRMFEYLTKNDMANFLEVYKDIVLSFTSYMDAKENAYHMLFLGMAMYLRDDYDIKSNYESGHGRSDITLRALQPSRQHIIIEFKRCDEKELHAMSKEALQQIQDKMYYSGLTGQVLCIGIAHAKKWCALAYDVIAV